MMDVFCLYDRTSTFSIIESRVVKGFGQKGRCRAIHRGVADRLLPESGEILASVHITVHKATHGCAKQS